MVKKDVKELTCSSSSARSVSYRVLGGPGGSGRSQGLGKALGFRMTATTSSNLIIIPSASENIYLCWQLKKRFIKAEGMKSI